MTQVAPHTRSGFGTFDPEQLGRLVDQLPVVLWCTDRDLRITSRRGGGLILPGETSTTPENLRVGLTLDDPALVARVLAAHQAALAGEATGYELTFRSRTISARVEPLREADGRVCGVAGLAVDITERKHAELALQHSEERLRLVSLATNDAVWDWDLVTDAVWWGHGFQTLFWYEEGELEPRAEFWYKLMHPDDCDRITASVRAAIDAGNRAWSGEYRFRRRDGSYADVLDRGYVIHDPRTQAPIRMVGSMMDVTERKRSQEQLQESRTALRLLATRHQDVREHERTRIAREIHDSLGQALTALKLQLSAAQEAAARESPPLSARLQETTAMVDDLVKSVRRIATDLRPPILDQLGLPAAVEWLAQDFSRRTHIHCAAVIHPTDDAIGHELATALFRIVQEALTNVLRHAGATRVDIELGMKSGCVALEINDDGTGITEAGTIGPGSLGILGMRERAAALGGVLEVAPRPAGGTRVAAWFPPPPNGARSTR